MACDIATDANQIMGDLLSGVSFPVPNPDVGNIALPVFPAVDFAAPVRLSNSDLTERKINGSGTFDAMMQAVSVHMKEEYEKGRITGAEYAKVYIAALESVLSNATQFLLGRDQAYWTAIAAQQQAKIATAQLVQAQVDLQIAKVNLAMVQNQAMNAQAEYALTKAKLATEEANYCTAQFQLNEILPQEKLNLVAQGAVLASQKLQIDGQTALVAAQKLNTEAETIKSGAEKTVLDKQALKIDADKDMVVAQKAHLTDKEGPKVIAETQLITANKVNTEAQLAVINEQKVLVKEQAESQRAQTLETRSDGSAVLGAIGKQKELHAQQIISYQRDSELKAGKFWVDAWITQKTIDEGILPPDMFTNVNVNSVLQSIKTKNGI